MHGIRTKFDENPSTQSLVLISIMISRKIGFGCVRLGLVCVARACA